jgi:hypothetical protein
MLYPGLPTIRILIVMGRERLRIQKADGRLTNHLLDNSRDISGPGAWPKPLSYASDDNRQRKNIHMSQTTRHY